MKVGVSGTKSYLEPNLYLQASYAQELIAVDLYKTDIFSLGVTFIECFFETEFARKINRCGELLYYLAYEKLHKIELPIQIK